jgi:hypothetical protein
MIVDDQTQDGGEVLARQVSAPKVSCKARCANQVPE